MKKEPYIEAGRIVNTHGLRGEVKIECWLDSPEYLAGFPRLYVRGEDMALRAARVQKGFVIAALEGVEDINGAMALKNTTVYIHREDAGLPEGGYFLTDILGARVVTEDGKELGVLMDILERPASDIYVVDDGLHERLIPAVPEFVRSVDVEGGVITLRLIEGL